jgi:ATP-dependent helicase/nuclease subunit A
MRAEALLPDVEPERRDRLLDDAERLLDAPHLAGVFSADSLAEVEFVAEIDGRPARGAIDRLCIGPDRVRAIDFKSNRVVPQAPGDTPEGLLRQMGAYAAALSQIYPGRAVETAILWTATGTLMPLPNEIVMAALARSATS